MEGDLAIWVIIGLGALGASVAATISGFGSATLMTPLLILLLQFDVKSAIYLVSIYHGTNSLFKVTSFGKHINWNLFLSFGLPAILFSFLGASLIGFFDQAALLFILGIFLSGYAISGLQGKPLVTFSEKAKMQSLIGGSYSGLLAGLIGTGGAIRAFFLKAFNLSKEPFIATSAAIALVSDITRIPIYAATDISQYTSNWQLIALLVVCSFGGVHLAKRLVHKMAPENFDRIVLWTLLVFGIYYTEKSIRMMFFS